jgi:hypothetical protein
MVQYSGKDLGDFRAFLETQFRTGIPKVESFERRELRRQTIYSRQGFKKRVLVKLMN